MSRLTITLRDERYQALKETAARQRKTIGQIIDEGLDLYGVKTLGGAQQILEKAWTRAGLTESRATGLAVKETLAQRRRRRSARTG